MQLRAATAADAEAIERVRSAAWRLAYRGLMSDALLDAFAGDLERRRALLLDPAPGSVQLVAEDAGRLLGWVAGGPSRDPDDDPSSTAEIYACYVAPAAWRGGVGRRLLHAACDGLAAGGRPTVTPWVLRDNEPARRFYEAMGLSPDGAEQTIDVGEPVVEVRYRKG